VIRDQNKFVKKDKTMRVLVIGGGGMLGHKLIQRIAVDKKVLGAPMSGIIRQDVVLAPPPPDSDFPIETLIGDISLPGEADKLMQSRPDVIFNLAAVVSGEAEEDFDKGYRINLDGMRFLLEAIRKQSNYKPKLIFTSSIAVFGQPFPDAIGDEFFTTPLTSYGTQKAICELLLSDYSRKGFVDGISMRMPTVCVRPGKPNKAASGFFSNIIREPLAGKDAVLPVDDTVRHWHVSPRSAVAQLIHGARLDTAALGNRRALTMPGLSCTVAEQITALEKVAGKDVVKRIRREPDEKIIRIVAGWPRNFNPQRAVSLGFTAEKSFEDIVRVHIEDELS
jgi:D-erythronate 2-dehydrogenase